MSGQRLEGSKFEIPSEPQIKNPPPNSLLGEWLLGGDAPGARNGATKEWALDVQVARVGDGNQREALNYRDRGAYAEVRGKYAEAEKYYKKASSVTEPQSVMASVYNASAGQACELDGRWADAQKYYRESLKIDKALLPADSVHIAASISNIARMDARQGNIDAAEEGFREATRMFKKSDPATWSDIDVEVLAKIYREQSRLFNDREADLLKRFPKTPDVAREKPDAAPKKKEDAAKRSRIWF